MKSIKILIVIIFGGLMIVSLPLGAHSKEDYYKIGVVTSITGPGAPLGDPQKKTLEMLEEEINRTGGVKGTPIKLIIHDDASDESRAVLAVKSLIEKEKVLAIIGSAMSGCSLAMIPIVEREKIPQISVAASIEIVQPVKKWVFSVSPSDRDAVIKIIQAYLEPMGIKKVAMLNVKNAYGDSGRKQLIENSKRFGIQVVLAEYFGAKDTDMTAQLTKIKGTDAQALIVWGTNPGPALVVKNAKDLGYKIPIIQSFGSVNEKFIELAGDAAEGTIFVATRISVAKYLPDSDPAKEVTLNYMNRFKERYGREADTFGGNAWTAFKWLVYALNKSGPDREKIRNDIEGIRNFVGIPGNYSLSPTDHCGVKIKDLPMIVIKGNKFVPWQK